MSSTSLSTDDLLRRVAGMVGRSEAGVLSQPPMRSNHGYVSLVSVRSSSCFAPNFFTSLILTVGIFVRPQGLRGFKLSRPPVPEDAADRAARRLAAEKEKEKKDAEKAWAREKMRAREALEKHRWRQARDGLPLESSPDTPDDDDDDDEDDDMAARLGLSPDPRLDQGSSSQPPGGLAPPELGAGMPGSRSEERRRAEGVLDPLAEIIGVTPGGQADPRVPQEQAPVLAIQEVGPSAVGMTPRQAAPSAPRAPEVEATPKPAAGQPSVAPEATGAEAPPRGHDWPCPGAGKYLRIPLFWLFLYVS
jgi:hypothetical protein